MRARGVPASVTSPGEKLQGRLGLPLYRVGETLEEQGAHCSSSSTELPKMRASFLLITYLVQSCWGGNQTILSHPVNSLENVSNSKACGILINTNSLGSSSLIFVTWAQPLNLVQPFIHCCCFLFQAH